MTKSIVVSIALAISLGRTWASSSLDCSLTEGARDATVVCVSDDQRLIRASLVAIRIDASGSAAVTKLQIAGQGSPPGSRQTFTARVPMLPSSGAHFLVSAAFRGQIRRVLAGVKAAGQAEAFNDYLTVARVLHPHPKSGSSTVINFDELQDGTSVANLEPNLQFANATALAAGISLNEFEFPPRSTANVAGDVGGPITITFSQPVYSFGGYFTYLSPVSLKAFDANGNQLTSAGSNYSNNLALSGVTGSTPNELIQVHSNLAISKVTLAGDPAGSSLAVDDLQISTTPPPPSILSVQPDTAQQGRTLANVVVIGQNTHFLQGTTTANFGAGINVNSLTVSSATAVTANISISGSATPGPQTVTITTGTEVASLTNGFSVTPPAPGWPSLVWLGGGHTSGVSSVGASPDGTVWSAGGDGTIKQWNASNMAMLQTLPLTQTGAAFAANGQQALVATSGQTQAMNLADGSVIRTFAGGNRGSNYDLAISANGQTYAFGQANWGPDQLIFAAGQGTVYNVNASFNDSEVGWVGGVGTLAVSPDGQYVAATLGSDYPAVGVIRLYRVSDGTLVRSLTYNTTNVTALAFSTDGSLLASSSSDGKINVLRLADLVVVNSIGVFESGNPIFGTALAFSPDGTMVAQGDTHAARIYRLSDSASLARIPGNTAAVSFTPDSQWLVVGTDQGVRLWLVATVAPLPGVSPHSGSITAVAYSPKGDMVASASADLTVKLRKAVDGTLIASLSGQTATINAIAFSPDGDLLATASTDHTVRIWHTADQTLVTTLTGHTQAVLAVAFSPDGSVIATGSAAPEQVVKLWSVGGTWANTSTLTQTGGNVTSLQFSPNGQALAGASDGGVVRIWQPVTGAIVNTYLAPSNGAMSLAYSPDSQLLVAGWGQNILVFQGTQTAPTITVPAHSKGGTAVAYSPDGQRVLSGNPDGTLKLWNPAGWGLVTSYNQETFASGTGVTSVGYSADNTRFVYGRGDATIGVAGTGSASIPAAVTVTTSPAGLAIVVDSSTFSSPQTFAWTPGTSHTISVASPQGANGTRQVLQGWSDGGAATHTVTPFESRIYIANFQTQYLLTQNVSPAGGGTITPSPTSPDGYYPAGTSVKLTAVPANQYAFGSWSDDASGTAPSVTLLMNQPHKVTANFSGVTSADIAVAMTASVQQVNSGKPLAYTVTVTNLGPGASTDGRILIVNLPAVLTFVSASSSHGNCTGSVQILCPLGTISANGTVTATINVTPNTPSVISVTVTASVDGGTADPNPNNNGATATVTVYPSGQPPILWMGGAPYGHYGGDTVQTTTDGLIWVMGPQEITQYRASDLTIVHTIAPDVSVSLGASFQATSDGKLFAYNSTATGVGVYSADGTLIRSFTSGSYVALSDNGEKVAYTVCCTVNKVGNLLDGTLMTVGSGEGIAKALSPDGTLLAVGTNGAVNIYSTTDGSLQRSLTGLTSDFGTVAVRFSHDGSLLIAANGLGLAVWRLSDFLLLQDFSTPIAPYNYVAAAISRDGQFVAYSDLDHALVWSVADGSLVATIPEGCFGLDITPDNKQVFSGEYRQAFLLPQGIPSPNKTGTGFSLEAVAYSPAGNLVATAGNDSLIAVRDSASGAVLSQESVTITNPISGLAFSPDGTKLAAGLDKNVSVWNTSNYGVITSLTGHTQPVTAVAFSPDGTLLASASTSPEQVVKLWSTQTWTLVRTLVGASGGLRSVQFSPDGTKVIAAGDDGIAREWNVTTGTVVHSYLASGQGSLRIQYSPDGTRLAAGWNGKLLVFNEGSANPTETLSAHTGNNTTVAWSPDGTRVVSANPDGTVDVWDTSAWGQLAQYNQETYAQNGGVLTVAYSPDGSQFAYGRADSVIVAVSTGLAPTGSLTTVTTNPSGLSIVVDGATLTSPQTFRWSAGTTHTIGAPSPQTSTGTRYLFQSWSDGGGQTHAITTPSTPATYTAQFDTQYLLTPTANPSSGGSVLITPTSPDGYYDTGTVVQAIATANTGYFFGTWSGNASGTGNPLSLTMTGPEAITANFNALPTTVIDSTPTGLSLSVDGTTYTTPQSFSWTSGTTHTVAALPTQGARSLRYAFSSWSDGGVLSHNITAPGSSMTLTLTCSVQYPLATSISPAPGGTITANPPSADGYYDTGASVQLSVSAASGYRFGGWSGDLTGTTSPQSVSMTGSKSVTASFVQVPVLSISSSHAGNFTQGQTSATYTLIVTNSASAGPTSGTVTVTESVPTGITLGSMKGTGWTCPGTAANNCTRSDVLPAGASYTAITVTVTVTASPGSLTNQVSVSGGGSATASANDLTTIATSTCDVNKNGGIISDVQAVINESLGTVAPAHDLNHDGSVNLVDAQVVMNWALGLGCSGS